jgi:hypothetical protein
MHMAPPRDRRVPWICAVIEESVLTYSDLVTSQSSARGNVGIRLTVTYFSSSWHHRNLAHPSKTKIKQFVCVTFKPALRASQIGIVPHPTQYMYYDVYICISIHLFREILHCWSYIHFIFAWNTTTIPHCYCFCCWSAFAVTHQTSILLVLSVQSKDLPHSLLSRSITLCHNCGVGRQGLFVSSSEPAAPLDVTACFPNQSRSAITVEWVVKDCLFFCTNRQHPWTRQLAFPVDHALP